MPSVRHALLALVAMSSLSAAEMLLPPELTAFGFQGRKEFGQRELVPVTGQSFVQAWRVAVTAKPEHDWMVNSLCDIDKPLAKGDILALSFWMRAEPRNGGASVDVRVQHQRGTAPFVQSLNHVFHPTATWMEYKIAYRVVADYAPKETRIALFFAADAPQTIEFSQVSCVNHGKVDPATLGLPLWTPPKTGAK